MSPTARPGTIPAGSEASQAASAEAAAEPKPEEEAAAEPAASEAAKPAEEEGSKQNETIVATSEAAEASISAAANASEAPSLAPGSSEPPSLAPSPEMIPVKETTITDELVARLRPEELRKIEAAFRQNNKNNDTTLSFEHVDEALAAAGVKAKLDPEELMIICKKYQRNSTTTSNDEFHENMHAMRGPGYEGPGSPASAENSTTGVNNINSTGTTITRATLLQAGRDHAHDDEFHEDMDTLRGPGHASASVENSTTGVNKSTAVNNISSTGVNNTNSTGTSDHAAQETTPGNTPSTRRGDGDVTITEFKFVALHHLVKEVCRPDKHMLCTTSTELVVDSRVAC